MKFSQKFYQYFDRLRHNVVTVDAFNKSVKVINHPVL